LIFNVINAPLMFDELVPVFVLGFVTPMVVAEQSGSKA
jgi:hypothetical protein